MIRSTTVHDAEAVVRLRALVYPYLVQGVEATRRIIAQPPPGEHWIGLVAEVEGRIVGWASAYRNGTTSAADVGEVSRLHVHPGYRRGGIGTALLGNALRHLTSLGIGQVRAWALPESLPFARKRGFEPSREVRYSALELRRMPALPPPPDGVRLISIAELGPRRMYAADVAATADEPGDLPTDAVSYDRWRYDIWDSPDLDHAASVAAIVGGDIAAFSLVKRDGDRMWSDMTATAPEYRGQGLARLAKLTALHRAYADGATTAYTSNDENNRPMLAINERLGYRPVGAQWSCLAELV